MRTNPTRQGWTILASAVIALVIGRLFGILELFVIGAAMAAAVLVAWAVVRLWRPNVNVHRWIDAARAELDERESDVAFRRTVDGVAVPELPVLDPDLARQRARERFVRTRRPVLDGQLAELRALDELDLATELVRRDTVIADLAGTCLVFEGKEVRFPDRLAAELEFLVTVERPFRGSDLPGPLDEAGRLVLLRRLVREGFLRRTVAAV